MSVSLTDFAAAVTYALKRYPTEIQGTASILWTSRDGRNFVAPMGTRIPLFDEPDSLPPVWVEIGDGQR